ncbi:MAG: hypothetical protein ABL936_01450 [Aestuariivirga sp.]
MNFTSLLPWNWVKLDPIRTQAARAHFDVTGKYDLWQAYCRQQFRRETPSSSNELASKGVEVIRLLSAAEASDAKALLLSNSEQFSAAKKGIDYADVMRFKDSKFLQPIIEKMLNGPIDAMITRVFESEFYVHSLVANRTMPAKVSKRSFLWHCDRGPKNFLKINMFLDATSEHGGTTEFLDIESSKGFEDAGYTFGANARRVADIAPVARKFGGVVNAIHPELDAGEAFIFFPARTLHRGFLPNRGIRHMLSLVLLPSPIHWTEAWKKTSETGYHMKTFATFPDNAGDLYAELGLSRSELNKAA